MMLHKIFFISDQGIWCSLRDKNSKRNNTPYQSTKRCQSKIHRKRSPCFFQSRSHKRNKKIKLIKRYFFPRQTQNKFSDAINVWIEMTKHSSWRYPCKKTRIARMSKQDRDSLMTMIILPINHDHHSCIKIKPHIGQFFSFVIMITEIVEGHRIFLSQLGHKRKTFTEKTVSIIIHIYLLRRGVSSTSVGLFTIGGAYHVSIL